jgi:hypothetical protein
MGHILPGFPNLANVTTVKVKARIITIVSIRTLKDACLLFGIKNEEDYEI